MIEFLAIFFLLAIIFHIFVYHEYNWPDYVKSIEKIPGPDGNFFFGSSLKFYGLKNEELLYEILNGFKKWGPTYRLWYSGVAVVFVSNLSDIQIVLSSRESNCKGMMYNIIRPWLGSGLLTSSGEKWRKMRKIITPSFHFSILKNHVEIFAKNAKFMMKILELESDKEDCDLSRLITNCALDNICETAMGIRTNALGAGSDVEYVRAIYRMGQILAKRLFSPIFYSDASFAFSSMGREHSRILKILHGFTRQGKEKKEAEEQEMKDGETEMEKNHSFLDLLLKSRKTHSLSVEDIREELDTFLFEGHDTTSASLVWTLFEIGHHPEIQDECFRELKDVFGYSERLPTHRDLGKLIYLKRVFQEALRLYPSVPVISRKFAVDIQLNDYLIPANTEIVLVLYAIHRNPETFPDPDKFDPDRFLPETVEGRHSFSYVPFSAGQRNCIGQKFATLEALATLSSILRRFEIRSLDDRKSVKVVPEMILRPNKKLRFKLTRRNDRSINYRQYNCINNCINRR